VVLERKLFDLQGMEIAEMFLKFGQIYKGSDSSKILKLVILFQWKNAVEK
jgi:hypothetical protein